MVVNRQKFLGSFLKIMSIVYLIIGVALLIVPRLSFSISDSFYTLEGSPKVIMGLFLIVYGGYRAYMSFQNSRGGNSLNIWLTIVFVTSTLFASCRSNTYKDGAWSDQDTILVSIDETFKPIMQSGYEVFTSTDTLSEMVIEFVPENVAIGNVLTGRSTLAVASRQLTPEEVKAMNTKSLFPKSTKIAIDAIAVITHKSNPDSVLSVKEISEILSGKITNWNQIGKNQKDQDINVIFDNNESGIVRYMADTICKGIKVEAKAFAMTFNTEVIDYVASHENAVGFIGASWISDSSDTLHLSFHNRIKVMAICESDDKVHNESFKPYQAYMFDNMYPFTRNIYIINAEPKDGKATRFANFMAGERGQRIILKSGIFPAVAPTRMIHVTQ
jgi:phosphate transport system substrate-binding protein